MVTSAVGLHRLISTEEDKGEDGEIDHDGRLYPQFYGSYPTIDVAHEIAEHHAQLVQCVAHQQEDHAQEATEDHPNAVEVDQSPWQFLHYLLGKTIVGEFESMLCKELFEQFVILIFHHNHFVLNKLLVYPCP